MSRRPTTSALSFQQSGKVTGIFVKAGDHVTAGQQLAQVDDTQQQRPSLSAQASLTSAEANLAALLRGETSLERAKTPRGRLGAPVGHDRANRSHPRAAVCGHNVTKYQQQIDQAQTSGRLGAHRR